ncbi:MAG: c-type cytochrome [Leptolyngbyaceae cyanobacterium T60_A2020_046]|nr:c-type cytochrome [Leptolyngbyaceae cyanobacterium T60_A2020_046]
MKRQFRWRGFWIWVVGCVLLLGWPAAAIAAPSDPLPETIAAEPRDGAALFELHCAGCHVNGGNIVRRGKTLKLRALTRNGVDSVGAIATLVTQGKGTMSAYGDRLSADDIDAIAQYVWQQAEHDWK